MQAVSMAENIFLYSPILFCVALGWVGWLVLASAAKSRCELFLLMTCTFYLTSPLSVNPLFVRGSGKAAPSVTKKARAYGHDAYLPTRFPSRWK